MKVVTAEQMRGMDRRAIEEFGIPGVVLMENAGRAVYEVLCRAYGPVQGKRILIFCGAGNNGGDGFVVARYLQINGAQPHLFLTGTPAPKSDAKVHFDLARALSIPCDGIPNKPWTIKETVQDCDLIVDALLGTGLREAPRDVYAEAIRAIQSGQCPVVAVDIPSGVVTDTGAVPGEVVRADHTVTFAYPKPGHFLFPGAAQVGKLHIADIGFDWSRLNEPADYRLLSPDTAKQTSFLEKRFPDANKGDFGHVAIIAGSRGMAGAPALMARAAQRAGAGLVTVLTPACIQQTLAAKLDEQMTLPLPDKEGALSADARETIERFAERATVFCIGPGLTTAPQTVALVQSLVCTLCKPLVLDADGLNALALNPDIVKSRPEDPRAPLILTPHPGEAARLLGTSTAEVQSDRIGAVRELTQRYNAIVLLKGRYTLISAPDSDIAFNTTGNPGMATGGSGDTLAGLLGGLLARAFAPLRDTEDSLWDTFGMAQETTELGALLHGLAGDIAAERFGEAALTAGDIIDCLPRAWQRLEEQT
jgi:NAD(P)H-hydrate epimerase